jgi:hypothetical protein
MVNELKKDEDYDSEDGNDDYDENYYDNDEPLDD